MLRPLVSALLKTRRGRARMMRMTVARPESVPAADAIELINGYLDAPGFGATNAQMRGHVFEDGRRIDVPVTIAWGRLDDVVGPPRPERMPPGTRYLVKETWGHTPSWDDPEGVAELILGATARDPAPTPLARSAR
jgi:pimeloyl-ACP methyl ester carboxylesterase